MLDLVKRRNIYFLISAAILFLGLLSLLLPGGLKLGIEFSSGSTLTVVFEREVRQEEVRGLLVELGYPQAIIQGLGEKTFLIRTRELTSEEKEDLEKALSGRLGGKVLEFYSVSPIVAREIGKNTAIAIVAASIGILLYIAWAFRRIPRSFRWGSCAVVALIHDVLVVLGVFSILGRLFNIQIDALFITAILAVVGYSVNNTVVVFDRLRENITLVKSKDLAITFNHSLVGTLGRCLNTSLTTLFVLLSLLLFGGLTIKNFILALTIGLIAGTYSSLFIAPQLLLSWEKGFRLR